MKIVLKVTYIIIIAGFSFLSSCNFFNQKKFNEENSDAKAIEIADQVMETMGGEKNWDATKHIRWNFFDVRSHFWNKRTGDVRIESLKDDLVILMNIDKMKGKVFKNGSEVIHPDSVKRYIEDGKKWWINDSYWLVMPFKLKDPGVTLKYIGEDEKDPQTEILQLTFEEVGVTPENKYWVYVDKNEKLITKWAYFKKASQAEPDFVMPWENYQKHGEILLSGNRGEGSLTNIAVYETLPNEVYRSFDPVNINQ